MQQSDPEAALASGGFLGGSAGALLLDDQRGVLLLPQLHVDVTLFLLDECQTNNLLTVFYAD